MPAKFSIIKLILKACMFDNIQKFAVPKWQVTIATHLVHPLPSPPLLHGMPQSTPTCSSLTFRQFPGQRETIWGQAHPDTSTTITMGGDMFLPVWSPVLLWRWPTLDYLCTDLMREKKKRSDNSGHSFRFSRHRQKANRESWENFGKSHFLDSRTFTFSHNFYSTPNY